MFLYSQSSQKTLQSVQNKGMRCILDILNRLTGYPQLDKPSNSPPITPVQTCVTFLERRGPALLLRLLSKRHFRNRPSTRASFRQTFGIPLTANKTADCAFSVTMPRILNDFDDVLLDAASLRIFNSHLHSPSLDAICDNT